MDKIKGYILTLNDSLLIKLTNKGLLKRAYKDYENGFIPEVKEKANEIIWTYPSNNIECSLSSPDLAKGTCSCPSSDICRHILTGIIHLQKFLKTEDQEKEAEKTDKISSWEKLYEITDKELGNLVGKKNLKNALEALAGGIKIEIIRNDTIEATFPELEVKCIFLPYGNFEAAICSCKRNICNHKLMAFLKLQIDIGKRTLSVKKIERLLPENIKPLEKLQEIIKELLITGLERASYHILNQLEALAIELYNHDLPRMEKETRAIKREIQFYLEKNAQFDINTYINSISRIYGIMKLIKNFDGTSSLSDLTGIHKTKYMGTGNMKLAGIGCRAWKTSKYSNLTTYFLNENKDKFFSFTISRPDIYEGVVFSPARAYYNEFPWDSGISSHSLSRKYIILNNCARNMDGRLSGSKETKILLQSFVNFEDLKNSPFYIKDWNILLDKVSDLDKNIYIRQKENSNLFFLKVTDWARPEFNEVKQELTQKIFDGEKREVLLRLSFSTMEEPAIKNIELLYEKSLKPLAFLAFVYIKEGFINILPLTAYFDFFDSTGGCILNLNLDKEFING